MEDTKPRDTRKQHWVHEASSARCTRGAALQIAVFRATHRKEDIGHVLLHSLGVIYRVDSLADANTLSSEDGLVNTNVG